MKIKRFFIPFTDYHICYLSNSAWFYGSKGVFISFMKELEFDRGRYKNLLELKIK